MIHKKNLKYPHLEFSNCLFKFEWLLCTERERERERGRDVRDIERESERDSRRALPYRVCALVENLWEISQAEI